MNKKQWEAMIALHRTLLYEHHDFLLASQHPTATEEIRNLPIERQIPYRMWKYAIHAFLEVLRQHLPGSIEFMLNFIYLAYQMMALLYETVPQFEDVWTECLGDLARYRMAIESKDVRDREIWAGVARYWYSKASSRQPYVGRLYHHLGILTRPNALEQLYYYCKSLTCVNAFGNTKASIKSVLDAALGLSRVAVSYPSLFDASFIKIHALMFNQGDLQSCLEARAVCYAELPDHVGRQYSAWLEEGAFVAVTNIAALFAYDSEKSLLARLYASPDSVSHKRLYV